MTTGDWYTVNWEDQRQAAAFVQKGMDACSNEIESVTDETNGMLQEWKEGVTKEAFSQRQQTFLNAANEIVAILGRFRGSLQTSADIAEATELASEKRMQAG